ncbi:MAG: glycosyltransferase family 4 protein [Myxococcota bacterium]
MSRGAAVVFAYDYPPAHHTGMGTHIHELVRGLGARGVACHVLVPDTADRRGAVDVPLPGVTVHRVEMTRSSAFGDDRSDLPALLAAANEDLLARAVRLGREVPVRLLHCHDFYFVPAALRLREALGAPVVSTVHMAFDPLVRWWGLPVPPGIAEIERAMCLQSDALVTVSRSMAERPRRDPRPRPRRHRRRLQRLRSGRLRAAGRAARRRRRPPRARRGPTVVYAGRIAPQKGVLELARAAGAVHRARPDVQWVLAGITSEPERAYADAVRAAFDAVPGLSARVRWLGRIDRAEVAALYRAAALAVVPSAYEPFGYAATEAMAARVPVVVSASGGLAEIVDDDTGIRVPWRADAAGARAIDVDALGAAILAVLADPGAARARAERAAERVARRFDVDGMVAATAAVYDRIAP